MDLEQIGFELRENNRLLQENNLLLRESNKLLHRLTHDNVTGGKIIRIGDTMLSITPGNTPKFQVSPSFSGAAFALVAAQASVTSSDTTNFPVNLDPTDPTGTIFEAPIPTTANPPAGGEPITITWTYTNTDGSVATVTGTVTEEGIVDDVTGGTFAQVE